MRRNDRAIWRWAWPAGWLALVLSGCATARTIDAGYAETAAALRERFARNEWTVKSTAESTVREESGRRLYIEYYEWEFPDIKVYCEVKATARTDGKTWVKVFVRDYDSWGSPFVWRPGWASGVLDAVAARVSGGQWGPMPWGGTALDPNRPATGAAPSEPARNRSETGAEPMLIPAR